MLYAVNKKARFDYEILETFEAGLVLTGSEVKSIRDGGMRLNGSYVTFHNTDANIIGANIAKYRYSSEKDYDPARTRRLLLKRKEINYLRGKLSEKGLTIVPLSVYTKSNKIKVELGVGKGKKAFDKRDSIKKRDQKREMMRDAKRY